MCLIFVCLFIRIFICGYSERAEPEPKSTEEVTLRFLFGSDKESYRWQVCGRVCVVESSAGHKCLVKMHYT